MTGVTPAFMLEPIEFCPGCKHPVSEHYGGCMVVVQEHDEGPDEYCDCDERFNLATKGRYPNQTELIEMLQRSAEMLRKCGEESSKVWKLAVEIEERLAGRPWTAQS